MKIVVDARLYGPRHGGLGRYVQQLILKLPTLSPGDEWVWLMGKQAADDYRHDVGTWPVNIKIISAPWRWYTAAEQWCLPPLLKKLKPDLIHYPHFNVPLITSRPFIVTIHDLIINHFPSSRATTLPLWIYNFKLVAYRYLLRQTIKRAQKIIVPTEFVKKDIIQQYPTVNKDKIVVTYEGVLTPDLNFTDQHAVFNKYNIQTPFLLYVGSAYPHKDLITALRAFKQLREQGIVKQFVHIWRNDEFLIRLQRQAQQEGLSKGVVWTGFVPDGELGVFYQSATAYVFLSLYEGFGLPPLEAQAAGCPVIAAQTSCLPEVLGRSVAWFEAGQTEQLVRAVIKVIKDHNYRQQLISDGYNNVKRFSWDKMVQQTLSIYNQVVVK